MADENIVLTVSLSDEDVENGLAMAAQYADGTPSVEKIARDGAMYAFYLAAGRMPEHIKEYMKQQESEYYEAANLKIDERNMFIPFAMAFLARAGLSAEEILQTITGEAVQGSISDTFKDELEKLLIEHQQDVSAKDFMDEIRRKAGNLIENTIKDIHAPDLQPYILEELKKPEYGGKDPGDLTINEAAKVLEAAKAARGMEPNKATIINTDKIDFTLDKLNSNAWNLFREDTHGQLKFDLSVNMAAKKNRQEAPVTFSINFDGLAESNLKISKTLQPFDRRLYQAVSALYNAGNEVVTLSSIYRHMGYRGRGGGNDIEKIRLSIIKMMTAQITLDNELELKTNRNYKRFTYRGALLPVEMGELYDIKGALTDAAIHVLREPPLITFARERKQITTIPLKLLQSPVNKNDTNIAIDDYLIERIKREKDKGVKSCRILYTTLFKRTGIDTTGDRGRKQRQRTPDKVKKFLDYYMTEDAGKFIRKYTEQSDGITIYF